jgi:hypothetical protein
VYVLCVLGRGGRVRYGRSETIAASLAENGVGIIMFTDIPLSSPLLKRKKTHHVGHCELKR